MVRGLLFASIGAALLSAFALYTISYQTRQVADSNREQRAAIEKLKRDIAVLRAERSYLMRPERLEPLARELGMRPMTAGDLVYRDRLQAASRRSP